VVLLDNLSTGSVENIRHLKSSGQMQYHLDSIENRQLLAELVDDADVIVHLAAAVGVKLIVESPVKTIETNVNGTQLILEAACKKKKLVLTASTSEVYGKNTDVPFREDADLVLGPTTKGRWSYAASKALDEFLALSYWKEKKLPVIVARLFNTVGPRQTGRYGMVLPNFVKSALTTPPSASTAPESNLAASAMCATPSKDSSASWTRSAPSARSSTSATPRKSPSRHWPRK